MNKTIKHTVPGLAVLLVLLFTAGCIDLFYMQSKTRVIAEGKGVLAPGFKPGIYESMDEKPERVTISWDDSTKEYEILKEDSSDRFSLLKLRRKFYLLQTRDSGEENYKYFIIKTEGGIIDFMDADKDAEKSCIATMKGLLLKYGLEMDEDQNITGTPKGMISLCKAVIKKNCIKSGHRLRRTADIVQEEIQ